jgi:hypothetical protein
LTDRLSRIISETNNTLMTILLNWEKIAGKTNREIMIPFELRNKVLLVAVPNGMVAKTVVRFKEQMIGNINRQIRKNAVSEIKFFVDTARFGNVEIAEPAQTERKIEISKTDITKKTKELQKQGISEHLAETLAEIELLIEKRKNS